MAKAKDQGGKQYRSQPDSLQHGDASIKFALHNEAASEPAEEGSKRAATFANRDSFRRLQTSQKYR